MEFSRKVCIASAAAAGSALAVTAGLLISAALAPSTPITFSGGTVASEVTQLDRVSGYNSSQAGIAETVYYSAHVQSTTLSLGSSDSGSALTRADLLQTDYVTAQATVYTLPDTSSQIVCCLLPGTVLTDPVQSSGQDWYEIYYNGLCGYVQAECLELGVSAGEIPAGEALTYTGTYGTLLYEQTIYTQADISSEAALTLSSGETVELLSGENGWYSVSYQGVNGYLSADYVLQTTEKPEWKAAEERAAEIAAMRSGIVETAQNYLGCSYVWAASGPNSFDCSGFTMYILGQYGISLPHSAASQFNTYGTAISQDQLQPGDLVFFSSGGGRASHVGIYIGDGQFIHASSGRGCVTINSLSDSWYSSAYLGARALS